MKSFIRKDTNMRKLIKKTAFVLALVMALGCATPVTTNAQSVDMLWTEDEETVTAKSTKEGQQVFVMYIGEKRNVYYGNSAVKKPLRKWKCNRPSVLSVKKRGTGKIIRGLTLQGLKKGKAKLSLEYCWGDLIPGDNYYWKKVTVTVDVRSVLKVPVKSVSLKEGQTKTVNVNLYRGKRLTVKAGKPSIVGLKLGKVTTAEDKSLVCPLTFIAKKKGSTTVTIGNSFNKEKVTVKVTVK